MDQTTKNALDRAIACKNGKSYRSLEDLGYDLITLASYIEKQIQNSPKGLKRYELKQSDFIMAGAEMDENPYGDYVKYADHVAARDSLIEAIGSQQLYRTKQQ